MGRPAKITPPPPAWQASGTIPQLLDSAALAALPQRKRCYLTGTDLDASASQLNRAFETYALWACGERKAATRSDIRDRMNRLAEQAAELRQALGHLQVEDRSGGFGDLLLHLAVALPKPEAITAGPNGERSARYRLERLVRLAVPELYSQTASQKTDPRFGDLIWDMASELIGDRLNAALEIIELLAGRVHEFYAARVREVPKEGSPALSRKELFARLAGHGLKAEEAAGVNRPSLPKGPAMDGFRALLKLIGDEATRALPESLPDGAEPNRDRAELLIELVDLAAAAGKGKAGDGLARCINDGARAYEMAPKLITEDFAPDIKPTSLEDLFG